MLHRLKGDGQVSDTPGNDNAVLLRFLGEDSLIEEDSYGAW